MGALLPFNACDCLAGWNWKLLQCGLRETNSEASAGPHQAIKDRARPFGSFTTFASSTLPWPKLKPYICQVQRIPGAVKLSRSRSRTRSRSRSFFFKTLLEEIPLAPKSPRFAKVKDGGCPKGMIHVDKLPRPPGKQRRQTYFYLRSKKGEKSQKQVVADDGKNLQL